MRADFSKQRPLIFLEQTSISEELRDRIRARIAADFESAAGG